MGYYGLGPGLRTADPLTPFEAALQSMPLECYQLTLDTMETLIKNIAQNPREQKYRKIKLANEKIRVSITSVDQALEALLLMGWELTDDEELVLPLEVKLSFPIHVKKILEAKQVMKKKEEQDRVSRGLSRVPPAQLAKEQAPKSAFQFQDRRVKEDAVARSEKNLAKLRRDKQEQFEINQIDAFGQLQQPPASNLRNAQAQQRGSQGGAGGFATATAGGSSGSTTVTVQAGSPGEERRKVESAFQFESRAKKEQQVEKAGAGVTDLRALQKEKYKSFKQDPNAFNNQQGFYSQGGEKKDESSSSWWDPTSWFGGGGGSSGGNPPPRGGGANRRNGPRIKSMADMPKPVRGG